MTAVILIPIIVGVLLIAILCVAQSKGGRQKKDRPATDNESAPKGYPYRPNVEYRLPNGRITTRGYAAVHPEQFVHWQYGPENVYGENIDRTDWENWRINYYGM